MKLLKFTGLPSGVQAFVMMIGIVAFFSGLTYAIWAWEYTIPIMLGMLGASVIWWNLTVWIDEQKEAGLWE